MELPKELAKQINGELDSAKNDVEAKKILKKYSNYELKGSQLGRAFEKMYVHDEGFSKYVVMEDLEKYHHSFHTTNGGDWCRTNQGYLGSKYNVERVKKNGKIYSVKTDGFNKRTKINQSIRSDILKKIQSKRCVILDINTNTECDHKDGMKDDWRLNKKEDQVLDDFQPLCKTANDAKRQHCKKCRQTGKRYDAKKLGYSKSYTFGNENTKICVGCYWYDPLKFNKIISKDFIKNDEK